jgi:hypothetical protein
VKIFKFSTKFLNSSSSFESLNFLNVSLSLPGNTASSLGVHLTSSVADNVKYEVLETPNSSSTVSAGASGLNPQMDEDDDIEKQISTVKIEKLDPSKNSTSDDMAKKKQEEISENVISSTSMFETKAVKRVKVSCIIDKLYT